MKGTITEREDKDKFIRVKVSDGNKAQRYSCWVDRSKLDQDIEFEFTEKNGFKNIVQIQAEERVSHKTNSPLVPSSAYNPIAFGNCMNVASRVYADSGFKIDDLVKRVFDLAEKLYEEGRRRNKW